MASVMFPRQAVAPGRPWWSRSQRTGAIGALILGVTAVRVLLAASLPLLPQEAYYWSWSRSLDWSYFDHPPLAAYSIALSTAIAGQTVFGIKLAAVAWSVGWNLLWARLVLDMYGDRRLAFWCVAVLNLCLLYLSMGVTPTPDGPLLFGWIGTIWALWRVSAGGDPRWWYAAGVFAGLAMIGKYAAVLLLPVVLSYLALSPNQRHWLRKPQPYLAMLIATLIFTPVIVWNADHGWASFAFQGSKRIGQMGGFKPHFLALLIGTQLLLVTPYLLALCLSTFWRGAVAWRTAAFDERTRLLWLSAAVPLVLFTLVSLRSHVKPNWLAPAYWSLIILGVRHLLAGGAPRWRAGLASSALVVVLALGVSLAPTLPMLRGSDSWSGWHEAAQRVAQEQHALQVAGQRSFVFSPNYKISSLLRFYLPGQERTYAQDIYGARALQFDHGSAPEDLRGATGLLVLSDQPQSHLDLSRLKPYFDSVTLAAVVETRTFGRVLRRIEIYRCENYKGHPRLTGQRTEHAGEATEAAE
jgi:4-amino-4-deoxy-L-arabinose transferase-like glycosyltransferase